MDYQICEVISSEAVNLNVNKFKSKDEIFRSMVSLLYKTGKIESEEQFLQALYEREDLGPTFMGNYIAIPHGKSDTVKTPAIAFCRCTEGGLYESEDEIETVKLIFMLAIPKKTEADDYLKVLAKLARMLIHEDFIEELYSAENYEDVINAIRKTEAEL